MEALIKFLQNNTIALIIMFIFTSLGTVMGIVLGWKKFYDDFLSKSITLPVYVNLIILFVVVALTIKFCPATKGRPKELQTIKGETFGTQRIKIDGKRFVNCKFSKTEFSYWGGANTAFIDCGFDLGPQSFVFEGSAIRTIQLLKELYSQPVFRPFVDHVFDSIKAGKLPKAIPPSDAADD